MQKLVSVWFVLLLLIVSACAPAATPQPEPTVETSLPTPVPTMPPAAEPTAVLTEPQPTQTGESEPPGGEQAETKVFKIVPGESRVTYEVGETFINQNNRFSVAVGVTTEVRGEIYANLSNPPESSIGVIEVDISQFKSDSSRRDGVIRNQWLESARYPIARFEPLRVEGLPQTYTEATPYAFRVVGNLTVKDVTREVAFDITAQLQGETLTGKATTTILMSDFGVGPISILGVLNTEDEVKLTFDFVARP
ncbi:MAG: YceI family protein [Chloroflexota bacterium]|nr:MAG: polyisoprenoid-binding protein [Bellilinea sp.]